MYKLWPRHIKLKAHTHNAGTTHIHQTEVVTTMSRSPQAGLTKTSYDRTNEVSVLKMTQIKERVSKIVLVFTSSLADLDIHF